MWLHAHIQIFLILFCHCRYTYLCNFVFIVLNRKHLLYSILITHTNIQIFSIFFEKKREYFLYKSFKSNRIILNTHTHTFTIHTYIKINIYDNHLSPIYYYIILLYNNTIMEKYINRTFAYIK